MNHHDLFARVVARLIQAGWAVAGGSNEATDSFGTAFTPLGLQRLAQLRHALSDLQPQQIPEDEFMMLMMYLLARLKPPQPPQTGR